QPSRVVQALHVVAETEHGRAFGRVVAADALEHAGAVMEAVNPDMNLGVGPVDELAVHPDLLGLLHPRLLSNGSQKSSCGSRCLLRPRPRDAAAPRAGAMPCGGPCRPRSRRADTAAAPGRGVSA